MGPTLLDRLELERNAGHIVTPFDTVTDFQLQIEHALDLRGRELVLFVDGSVDCPAPYRFSTLSPARDVSYTSHAVSPASLLVVYEQVVQEPLPATFLLAVPGYRFGLGEAMSAKAQNNLRQASDFAVKLLKKPNAGDWQHLTQGR